MIELPKRPDSHHCGTGNHGNAAADYASSRFIITDSDGGPILGAGGPVLVAPSQDDHGFIVDSQIRRRRGL
jgi:hypothetical protein